MSAQFIQLAPFSNVVASGIASCDLRNVLGYAIERLTLKLGGTFTKSMITSIALKANGKVILESTGSRMDSRMAWRGMTQNASFLTIDFTEIKARNKVGFSAGVLDTTIGLKDLRLEITISGATSPTLEGVAEVCTPLVDPELVNVRPLIARVHTVSQTIGAAGTFPLSVPHLDPNAGGSIFKRICVFSSNMTGARVERNGIREFEQTSTAANNFNGNEYGRTTQSGLFPIDFMLDGMMENRLLDTRPAAKTSTAMVWGTFSAGETIGIEVEVLEPLDVY